MRQRNFRRKVYQLKETANKRWGRSLVDDIWTHSGEKGSYLKFIAKMANATPQDITAMKVALKLQGIEL